MHVEMIARMLSLACK